MTHSIAMLGDLTSHGGRIITASPSRKVEGNYVARFGDICTCPIHGISIITTITQVMPVTDNRLTAHDGAKTSCGATILKNPFNSIQGEGTASYTMNENILILMDDFENGALTPPTEQNIEDIKSSIDDFDINIEQDGLAIEHKDKLNDIENNLSSLKTTSIDFDLHTKSLINQFPTKAGLLSSIKSINRSRNQETNSDDYLGSLGTIGTEKTGNIKESLNQLNDHLINLNTKSTELKSYNIETKNYIQNSGISSDKKIMFNDFEIQEPSVRFNMVTNLINDLPVGELKNNLSDRLVIMKSHDDSIDGIISGMESKNSELTQLNQDLVTIKNNENDNFNNAQSTLEKASSMSMLKSLYQHDSSINSILKSIASDDFITKMNK